MASNYPYPIVQLDTPYNYNGTPQTHAVIHQLIMDTMLNNINAIWLTAYYAAMSGDVLTLQPLAVKQFMTNNQDEFDAIVNVISNTGESAAAAMLRAATEWAVRAGHLPGTII